MNTFSTEYWGDHVLVEYEVDQGELLINEMWVDGIPVSCDKLWDELYDHVEPQAWDDYVNNCKQHLEDQAVAWMELHED